MPNYTPHVAARFALRQGEKESLITKNKIVIDVELVILEFLAI
jgi:hypothetical protein